MCFPLSFVPVIKNFKTLTLLLSDNNGNSKTFEGSITFNGNGIVTVTINSISQERWLKQPDKAEVRGNRRIEGFELLLDRSGDHISDKEKRRLKFALCVLTSLEALIVLKDSCQLSQAEAREVLDWATNILLRAVLPNPD